MILAVDCGLSGVKLTLATRGGVIAQAEREPYPTAHGGGNAEQDPEDWWRALRAACNRLRQRHRVEVVVPTGHMHALVLLDAAGNPVLPCLTLHDRRGANHLNELDPSTFRVATGQILDASLPIAKLLWLASERPRLLARGATLMAPKDYLGLRLSGAVVTDPLDASGTGLYDTAHARWSREVMLAAQLPESILPPIESCTAQRGTLLPDISRELDLPASAVVVVGAGDDIELLGATEYRTNAGVEHVGTSGAILRATRQLTSVCNLEIHPTAVAGQFAVGAAIANCAAVIAWIRTALGVELGEALAKPPSVDDPVALPQLLSERQPAPALGEGALVAGLRIHHDRVDVARALLIGVAGTLRQLLRRVERGSGELDVLVSSGGSSSRTWAKLRASAYERPISLLDVDPTARGCVAVGMVALGDAMGVADAVMTIPAKARQIEPDAALTRVICELLDRGTEHAARPITYRLIR